MASTVLAAASGKKSSACVKSAVPSFCSSAFKKSRFQKFSQRRAPFQAWADDQVRQETAFSSLLSCEARIRSYWLQCWSEIQLAAAVTSRDRSCQRSPLTVECARTRISEEGNIGPRYGSTSVMPAVRNHVVLDASVMSRRRVQLKAHRTVHPASRCSNLR